MSSSSSLLASAGAAIVTGLLKPDVATGLLKPDVVTGLLKPLLLLLLLLSGSGGGGAIALSGGGPLPALRSWAAFISGGITQTLALVSLFT
jgi:hypothetical protein